MHAGTHFSFVTSASYRRSANDEIFRSPDRGPVRLPPDDLGAARRAPVMN
jgi:hypothetical protein